MLEHCVFLGTEAFPTWESLRKEFQALGMDSVGCVWPRRGCFLSTTTSPAPDTVCVVCCRELGGEISRSGDSNAYTDFRETVFLMETPVRASEDDGHISVLPRALKVLFELVLAARLTGPAEDGGGPGSVSSALETEREVVLSEAAMRNTVHVRLWQRSILPVCSRCQASRKEPGSCVFFAAYCHAATIGARVALSSSPRDSSAAKIPHWPAVPDSIVGRCGVATVLSAMVYP